MPKRAAAPAWQQLQMQITCPKQYLYELIRPIVLTEESVADRAKETAVPDHIITYHLDHFRANGLPGLVAAPTPLQRAARFPEELVAFVLALKAEHPPLNAHELATICFIKHGRRPSIKTIRRVLAHHPLPQLTTRRFPPFHDNPDPVQRRRAILVLSADGWTTKSIAAYLQINRSTVYNTFARWHKEGFDGLQAKSRARAVAIPKSPSLSSSGFAAYSATTCWGRGACMRLSGVRAFASAPAPVGALWRSIATSAPNYPNGSDRRSMNRVPCPLLPGIAIGYPLGDWTVDIRYLDMHRLGGGHIYCISIVENYSRAILSSAISRIQDTTAVLKVLYDAVAKYGCPDGIVSDSGSVFRSHRLQEVCQHLRIQQCPIEKRQPWQSYIETTFGIQRRMADEAEEGFRAAQSWDALWHAHRTWLLHYNTEVHWAHRQRQDGRETPAEVLTWIRGRPYPERLLQRIFAATRVKRRLDRVGFLRVRRWRIYSEIGLAKEAVEVWLEPQHVTITYADHHLRSYPATIDTDGWIRTMEAGTRYEHPFGSRQLMLWDVIEDDWGKTKYVGSTPRRKPTIPLAEQLRFALG